MRESRKSIEVLKAHARIMELLETLEFYERIIKTMKVLEFHSIINKHNENLKL